MYSWPFTASLSAEYDRSYCSLLFLNARTAGIDETAIGPMTLDVFTRYPSCPQDVPQRRINLMSGEKVPVGDLGCYQITSLGLEFNVLANVVRKSRALAVFLPAARSADPTTWNTPHYSRWSWGKHLDASTIVLDDPTIVGTNLVGGWFFGTRNAWGMEAAAHIIASIAAQIEVPLDRVLLHGSSVGGFASLQLASLLKGAFALAEVPQTDLRTYPFIEAIRDLSQHVFQTQKFESVGSDFLHRFSVMHNWQKQRFVPPCHIIHEVSDRSFGRTQFWPFLTGVDQVLEHMSAEGRVTFELLNRGTRHSALPVERALPRITAILNQLTASD